MNKFALLEQQLEKTLNPSNIDPEILSVLNKVINFFPSYQNIMYQVFTTGNNMANDINELKKEFFESVVINYYSDVMEHIFYIISETQRQYKSKYFLAFCDFIDFIYQNCFYDIFSVKFQEFELKNPQTLTPKHLHIFNLIVLVEHVKYDLYSHMEEDAPKNVAILNTLKKRKDNSLLRINVCVNLLEKYDTSDDIYDHLKLIDKFNLFVKSNDFTDKHFKNIN
jgi:hypothetical protein